ncbi:alpha-amylase family protein [Novosphingobium sp. M1R2S20]|uniref:Alpha-amylase family protein n=1 Tax=Novosphingobium rhizovicinum TaxID=3228928 RepID=A0ABV3RDG3_9SPHN
MIPDLWYKNAIIYSLSLDSFLDADGDGVGDFRGAMRRLDYLQGLGVSAVWLAPFQPSPRRDHGYDVADYYGVDPRYGSFGDFVEFVNACRQRGMRVIMDLVLNHCSDQHPWFRAALEDPDSKYRDYFIWADEKPEDAHEGVVFPGVQESTWTFSPEVGAWYFHRFFEFQPDLNIANPAVQAEILKIVGFWLQLGVSGFRMDAVPFLIAADGINVSNPEPAYDLLRNIRAMAQWRKGDAVLLAEANIQPSEAIEYFGEDGDRLHMVFNFPVNQTLFYALATGDAAPLKDALRTGPDLPETAQWANFLRNHDELDLGRLSEAQRACVFEQFGPDPDMQIYDRGIRRRLAPMLDAERTRMELAYSLMLTLPGTPVLRYGDEIGMGDDLTRPERDAVRTPMQWSDGPNGGFSLSPEPCNPPISTGPYGFEKVNVAKQRSDRDSFLNWTERSIRLRKELPEVGRGRCTVLDSPDTTLALRFDWEGLGSIFIHNLAEEAAEFSLNCLEEPPNDGDLVCLQTNARSKADANGHYHFSLEPLGYRWFRFGGLDELIQPPGVQH